MNSLLRASRFVVGTLLVVMSLWPAPRLRAAEQDPTATPTPAAGDAAKPSAVVENAVVKVFSTARFPDWFKPWTKQAPKDMTGSGVVIEGKRILTNAHVVLYASQVQIQANQSGDKLSATVESIAPGIDLAVLKLDDASFFDSHPPLPLATILPDVKDAVMAYGYPTGGTSLSVTKGIVSRIEFTTYNHPVSGLRIQIDAAINPGNSGGPAVVDNKMIGLAYSHLGGAQNIGYIIPTEEIEIFLKDVADGKYDGKPYIFDSFQTLETPALRDFLKLDKSVEGIVVQHPENPSPTYPLKKWDVITKVGDTPVDNQGMVKIAPNLRVRFGYLVQRKAVNGTVPLTIVRNGKNMNVQVPAFPEPFLLMKDNRGLYPAYFICGPLVFSGATKAFLYAMTQGDKGAVILGNLDLLKNPMATRLGDKPAFEGEELVVVTSPFFPHKLSKGYVNPAGRVVKSINGKAVHNLKHLVELLRDSRDEFIEIDVEMTGGETMIFPRKDLMASTEEILNDNGVRSQGSPDTLAVWNEKPAK